MSEVAHPAGEAQVLVSARQCRFASQIFNIASMVAITFPVLVILWFGGSIFAYAVVGHHPDLRVRRYNSIAAYRFYGVIGALPIVLIFSGVLQGWAGGLLAMWLWVWALCALVLIPWGIWDYIRSSRETWRDLVVEVGQHDKHAGGENAAEERAVVDSGRSRDVI